MLTLQYILRRIVTKKSVIHIRKITPATPKPHVLLQKVYYSEESKSKRKTLQETKLTGKPVNKSEKWNVIKLTLVGFGITFICLGMSLVLVLGAPMMNSSGKPIKDDLSKRYIITQYLIRTCRELHFYIKLMQVPLNEQVLPDPLEHPYLQPKYTLVLELRDVLVHLEQSYIGQCKFKKRPLLDHFLQTLQESYEIIIYTAEEGKVVFSIMDIIDRKSIVAYKLVRGSTHITGTTHIKKLDKLNRDLSKVICVDWNAKNLKFHPENLLCIKPWSGNGDDTCLLDLAMFLKTIADNNIEDVREVLKYYRKYDDPVAAFRTKQEKLIQELEEQAAIKNAENKYKISSKFKI